MILRRCYVAAFFASFLFILFLSSTSASQINAQRNARSTPIVIFAVGSGDSVTAYIDPIVIINEGRYTEPPPGDADEAELSRFTNAYYRPNERYQLFFGGANAGSALFESYENAECVRTQAAVKLQTEAKLVGKIMGLASTSALLGRSQASRRAPTAEERASAVSLARDIYRQRGVVASLVRRMETKNLTAIDLDVDGDVELVGSFTINRGKRARHLLFLIAERQGNGYKSALSNYNLLTAREIIEGGNINAVGDEMLVDHLDVNLDGASEVFTLITRLESVEYTIYGKQQGRWRRVYRFGTYRCGF